MHRRRHHHHRPLRSHCHPPFVINQAPPRQNSYQPIEEEGRVRHYLDSSKTGHSNRHRRHRRRTLTTDEDVRRSKCWRRRATVIACTQIRRCISAMYKASCRFCFVAHNVTILTKKAKFHCRPFDNYASESRPLRNRACTCTFQLPCSDLDTTVTNFQFDQPCYWKIDRVCYYFVTNESYYWSLGWVYLSFYFFLSFLWRIKTAVVTLHNRYERKSSWQRLRRSVVLFLDRFWASCICRVCVHSRT